MRIGFAPEDELSDDIEDELTTLGGCILSSQKNCAHLKPPVSIVRYFVSNSLRPFI